MADLININPGIKVPIEQGSLPLYVTNAFGVAARNQWVFNPDNYVIFSNAFGAPVFLERVASAPTFVNTRGTIWNTRDLAKYFSLDGEPLQVWRATFSNGGVFLIFASEDTFADYIYLSGVKFDARTRGSERDSLILVNPTTVQWVRPSLISLGRGASKIITETEFQSPALGNLLLDVDPNTALNGNRPAEDVFYVIDDSNQLWSYNQLTGSWIVKDVTGLSGNITTVFTTRNNFGKLLIVGTDTAPYVFYAKDPDVGTTYNFTAFNFGPLSNPGSEPSAIKADTNNVSGAGYIAIKQGSSVTIWNSSAPALTAALQFESDDTILDFSVTSSGADYWSAVTGSWTTLTVNKNVSGTLVTSSKGSGNVFSIQDIAGTTRDREMDVLSITDPDFLETTGVAVDTVGNLWVAYDIDNGSGSADYTKINYYPADLPKLSYGEFVAAYTDAPLVINDMISYNTETGIVIALNYVASGSNYNTIYTENGAQTSLSPFVRLNTQSAVGGFLVTSSASITDAEAKNNIFDIACMCEGNNFFFAGRQGLSTWARYNRTGAVAPSYSITGFSLQGITVSTSEDLGFVIGTVNGVWRIYSFVPSTGATSLLVTNVVTANGFTPNTALTPGQRPAKMYVVAPGTSTISITGVDTVTKRPAFLVSNNNGVSWTKYVVPATLTDVDSGKTYSINSNSYICDRYMIDDVDTFAIIGTSDGKTAVYYTFRFEVNDIANTTKVLPGTGYPISGTNRNELPYYGSFIGLEAIGENALSMIYPFPATSKDGSNAFAVQMFVWDYAKNVQLGSGILYPSAWSYDSKVGIPAPVISGALISDTKIDAYNALIYWSGTGIDTKAKSQAYLFGGKAGLAFPISLVTATGADLQMAGTFSVVQTGEKETYFGIKDENTLRKYYGRAVSGGFDLYNFNLNKYSYTSSLLSGATAQRQVTFGSSSINIDSILGVSMYSDGINNPMIDFVSMPSGSDNVSSVSVGTNFSNVLDPTSAAVGFSIPNFKYKF
jgi:hypothetical protein